MIKKKREVGEWGGERERVKWGERGEQRERDRSGERGVERERMKERFCVCKHV